MKGGNILRRIVVILLFTSIYNLAQDQDFFTNISTESGLSSQKVTQIIQDKFGFLWFASQNGLNKYDGYSMSIYKNDPSDSNSISNNNLRLLSEHGNYLWIGTFGGGLNRFDRINHFKKYLHNPGDSSSIADNSINFVMFDKDSVLWVGTQKGLSRFMPLSESFKNYFINEPITHISEDHQSNLLLSTNNGFYTFNKNNGEYKKHYLNTNNSFNVATNILVDSDSIYWVGTDKGLKTFDPRS
ncbi:MAG: hypothetical protein KDC52_01205, partial [Ignavibacteriae bacterium]|nr:hypothetical protein [Ignavibacteriota bacterium]